MEFLLVCFILLVLLKSVFNVSVGILKFVIGIMLLIFLLPLLPVGLLVLGITLPLMILIAFIGLVSFVLKLIF